MRLFLSREPIRPDAPIEPARERTYTCHICRDVGLTYHYRPGAAGHLVTVVRPCQHCARGDRMHLIRQPGHANDGRCAWALRIDARCPLCGAHPGEAPPAAWMPRIETPVSVEQLADDRLEMAQHWAGRRRADGAGRG